MSGKFWKINSDVTSFFKEVNCGIAVNCFYFPGSFNLSTLTKENGHIVFQYKNDHWTLMNSDETYYIASKIRIQLIKNNSLFLQSSDYPNSYFADLEMNNSQYYSLKFPLDDFAFNSDSFDMSEIEEIKINTLGTVTFPVDSENYFTSNVQNLALENLVLVSKSEDIRYILSNQNDGDYAAAEIIPEFNYSDDTLKIQTQSRLWNGDLYLHKFGEYRVIKFDMNYYPVSDAITINSFYMANSLLNFTVLKDRTWTEINLKMAGKKEPFKKFQKPYIDLMTGKVHLESYD